MTLAILWCPTCTLEANLQVYTPNFIVNMQNTNLAGHLCRIAGLAKKQNGWQLFWLPKMLH